MKHHERFADMRLLLGMRFRNSSRRKLSPAENSVEELTKRQACWGHVTRSPKQIMKDVRGRFEQSSSCLLEFDSYPCQKHSKLRTERDYSPCTQKLDSGTFENHLENLWRSSSEEQKASFTHLDSMWFSLYLKEACKEKVLSWIKRRNIFLKKYVFVPIVCWGHWSLLIFCNFGESLFSTGSSPCMILLDSLQMADPRRLEPNIRKFVLGIYRAEGKMEPKDVISQIPLLVPKVPQQKNEECGRFVLYFIHLFMEAAPDNFSISNGYPYFMKQDWFTRESFDLFCKDLDRQLVIQANETDISLEQSFESDDRFR